ncbi:hypothetical protein NL676_011099 [Syzygium grande]|nr:hypothetical protein NL676_011099 [Syzygium grande]
MRGINARRGVSVTSRPLPHAAPPRSPAESTLSHWGVGWPTRGFRGAAAAAVLYCTAWDRVVFEFGRAF